MKSWTCIAASFFVLLAMPAAAEDARHDTTAQHHEWARKFAPSGSMPDALPPLAQTAAETVPAVCEQTEIVFGRLPVQRWRIGTCT